MSYLCVESLGNISTVPVDIYCFISVGSLLGFMIFMCTYSTIIQSIYWYSPLKCNSLNLCNTIPIFFRFSYTLFRVL